MEKVSRATSPLVARSWIRLRTPWPCTHRRFISTTCSDSYIIPRDYLPGATDWKHVPDAFRAGKATRYHGYGYKFWLFPGEKRRFVLLRVYGLLRIRN